jgi:hypothetical protein
MTPMQSKNLHFELLTATHADDLFPILTTPSVLAFIDETPPTIEELKTDTLSHSAKGTNSFSRSFSLVPNLHGRPRQ